MSSLRQAMNRLPKRAEKYQLYRLSARSASNFPAFEHVGAAKAAVDQDYKDAAADRIFDAQSWYPLAGLGALALLGKEIYILGDDTFLMANFALFVTTTYVGLGDRISGWLRDDTIDRIRLTNEMIDWQLFNVKQKAIAHEDFLKVPAALAAYAAEYKTALGELEVAEVRQRAVDIRNDIEKALTRSEVQQTRNYEKAVKAEFHEVMAYIIDAVSGTAELQTTAIDNGIIDIHTPYHSVAVDADALAPTMIALSDFAKENGDVLMGAPVENMFTAYEWAQVQLHRGEITQEQVDAAKDPYHAALQKVWTSKVYNEFQYKTQATAFTEALIEHVTPLATAKVDIAEFTTEVNQTVEAVLAEMPEEQEFAPIEGNFYISPLDIREADLTEEGAAAMHERVLATVDWDSIPEHVQNPVEVLEETAALNAKILAAEFA